MVLVIYIASGNIYIVQNYCIMHSSIPALVQENRQHYLHLFRETLPAKISSTLPATPDFASTPALGPVSG